MIRLICADVDGTLIGATGRPHPEVWDIADRARAEGGIRLAISSGRPAFGDTKGYAERLDPEGWHVFQNGSSVLQPASGASRSARLAPDAVASLVRRARATGRDLELYGDRSYTVESTSPRAQAHAGLLGVPYARGDLDAAPNPVVRGQWLLDLEGSAAVLAEPHPGVDLSPSTTPMMPGALFVSLMPPGVSKATGVRVLAEEYGIALDEVMFVGDGWNDVSAMQLVGWPIAMGNAEPELRSLARHIVGHVDDAGLVEAFELALAHNRRA